MKKTASILISFIILASLFLTAISAQAGKHYYYRYNGYSITDIDFPFNNLSVTSYFGEEADTLIPEKIYDENGFLIGSPNQIGSKCFVEIDFLKSVTIPNTVELIDVNAFESCLSLEKIIIPPSVKEIKEKAFIGCDKLTIYGYTNSVAEKYAKENNIPFESIGIYTEPTTPPIPTTQKPANTVKTTAKTTSQTRSAKPVVKTKKATIKKLTPKKKALKVTWQKVNGAKGYEIKLATNKKFTKGKKTVKVKKGSATSKTIKKLKSGKNYFVKIRAYKKVKIDGYTVTANGPWSKIKSKKVK